MLRRKLQYHQTRRSSPGQRRLAEINQRPARLEDALTLRQLLADIGANRAVLIRLARCQSHTLSCRFQPWRIAFDCAVGQTPLIHRKGVNQLTVFAEDMWNKAQVTHAQQIKGEQ